MRKMAMWAAVIAVAAGIAGSVPVYAAPQLTTRELVDSYIEADNAPVLMDTTAYIHGTVCCRGEKPREGIAAAAPEWYGMAAVVYEALPDGNNGYEPGELLGIWEILDTGYGKSTGDGVKSSVLPNRSSRGTIEAGKHIDIYKASMAAAKEWMEKTGGKCFVQVIPGKG